MLYIYYICQHNLNGNPAAEGERHGEKGRGVVRRQGTARETGMGRGRGRRLRQSSLFLNRSDCSCDNGTNDPNTGQLQ